MIKELDRIILTRDVSENKLKKGDIGIVVLIHDKSAGYEVEFSTLDGDKEARDCSCPCNINTVHS